MVKWIALAIALLPVAEIAVFVAIVSAIGAGWTLAATLATTLIGLAVLKFSGRGPNRGIRIAMDADAIALLEAAGPVVLAKIGGVLLVLPGFLTDLAGALMLVPAVGRRVGAAIGRAAATRTRDRRVVDLDPDDWRRESEPRLPRPPEQDPDRHRDLDRGPNRAPERDPNRRP